MNRLFETFIFRLIEHLLAGTGLQLHYQRGSRSIIVDASTNQPYARVVPDLLIEGADRNVTSRLAVDAKYKLYDERKLDSGNVYQAFLYAFAFGGSAHCGAPVSLVDANESSGSAPHPERAVVC